MPSWMARCLAAGSSPENTRPSPRRTRHGSCGASQTLAVQPVAAFSGGGFRNANVQFLIAGPDGRSYRVDTYLYYDQPSTFGGQVKVVTVVVRAANDLGRSLARETSTFDVATGS